MKEAASTTCCPSTTASIERLNPALAGRPDLMAGRTSLTVFEGMTGMTRECLHQREEPVAHDHRRGGDSRQRSRRRDPLPGRPVRRLEPLRKDGKPSYTYNWLGSNTSTIATDKPLPAGKATIRFEFAYDGGGPGQGGTGTIFVNGQKVAEGRIERTTANIFSARRRGRRG